MADEDIWEAVVGLAGEDIWRMRKFGRQFWGWRVRTLWWQKAHV